MSLQSVFKFSSRNCLKRVINVTFSRVSYFQLKTRTVNMSGNSKNTLKLLEKIHEFGTKYNITELQNLIQTTDINELYTLIENRATRTNIVSIMNYLFLGFVDNRDSHKKRYQIVMRLIKILKESVAPSNHIKTVMWRICTEFSKFQFDHLVKIMNYCIELIQAQENSVIWKELIPEILQVIVKRNDLVNDGNSITGVEYKKSVVNAICVFRWSSDIIISLAAMFTDSPLSKEEHIRVVNKLCENIDEMTPHEIPNFTYQMLQLCKDKNLGPVIFRLQDYFGKRIYSDINIFSEDSNDIFTDLDAIESTIKSDSVEAESTVLFHIHSAATSYTGIKTYINDLKIICKSPEYVLHPFQLLVLLSISCVSFYEDSVIELIKHSISKYLAEEQKRIDSAWFRQMVPSTVNFQKVLEKILNNKIKERELVMEGLVKLCVSLLESSPLLGRDLIAEKQWYFAKLILVKLISKSSKIAPSILKLLKNKILTGTSISQYTECLYQLCKTVQLEMLDNQTIITQLIEQMIQLPSSMSNLVILSVIPLMKISFGVRDSIILVLRKALYSSDTITRQMAVAGFTQLLKNLKISNLAAINQYENSSQIDSGRSILSQISIECKAQQTGRNIHSNEVLSLEVLNVLKRCFLLQAEVKVQLYDGLYDAVCQNSELQVYVLDMLYIHFKKFYVEEEDTLPPLKINSLVKIDDINVTLEESLGKLVSVIGLVMVRVNGLNATIRSLTLLQTVFDSVITRLCKCEPVHFSLDDGTDLLDILPESRKKQMELKEILSIYEAFLGYIILVWVNDKTSQSSILLSLFKSYFRFLDFAKSLKKTKKDVGKRKRDDSLKKTNPLNKQATFVLPPTVFSLEIIERAIELLHSDDLEWITKAEATQIRVNREFHRFVFNALLEKLQNIHNTKTCELEHDTNYLSRISSIGKIIFNRCVKRFSDVADFDRISASQSLEIFNIMIVIVSLHFKKRISHFFAFVGSMDNEMPLNELILPFLSTFKKLLSEEDPEADDEQGIKKTGTMIINTINLLVNLLPVSGIEGNQVLIWVKKFIDENENINKNTATALADLLLQLQTKYKCEIEAAGHVDGLFQNIACHLSTVLGKVDEEQSENPSPLNIINESTAMFILNSIYNILKMHLNDIDWIILRLRADSQLLNYLSEDNGEKYHQNLKSKEQDLCCHFSQVIELAETLTGIAIPPSSSCKTVLKVIGQLYKILVSLTKYFIQRSTKNNPVFHHARFEKVIQLAGNDLSTNVHNMFSYIEGSEHTTGDENASSEKKNYQPTNQQNSQVIQITKFIPKVVFEMEQLSKCVIQLSNKTKVDLKRYMRKGRARDFRIKAPILKEVLVTANDSSINESIDESTTNVSSEGENTVLLNSDQSDTLHESDDSDNETSSAKKIKTK